MLKGEPAMKKLLLIGSALALLSTSAMATQSRLLALGLKELDNEGSYYIQDSRNIFLNSANVNDYADIVVLEYGSAGRLLSTSTPNNTSIEQYDQPKAQGGVFRKVGDYVFGVYYGNESNTSSFIRVAGSSGAAVGLGLGTGTGARLLTTTDNQIDLFFAGQGSDLKWGTNFTFSNDKDEVNNKKDSAMAVRLGLKAAKWDAHLNASLRSKASSTDTIGADTVNHGVKGKIGIHVGGSYDLGSDNRVFGYVKTYGWEQTDSYTAYPLVNGAGAAGGQTGMVKGNFTTIQLGWGKGTKVNETGTIFTSIYARQTKIDLDFTARTEVRNLVVPLTLGYEAIANEWLTLRGSIVQNLYSHRDNGNFGNANAVARSLVAGTYGAQGKGTLAGNTEVNAGATATWGNLSVDGLIGITSPSRVGGTTQTAGSVGSPNKNQGVLALDNLASKVAMTYKF